MIFDTDRCLYRAESKADFDGWIIRFRNFVKNDTCIVRVFKQNSNELRLVLTKNEFLPFGVLHGDKYNKKSPLHNC